MSRSNAFSKIVNKPKKICLGCGKKFWRAASVMDICVLCSYEREKVRVRVRYKSRLAVAKAVKNGDLPRPDKCKCVDCGKRAFCYDHRDYTKPLDVSPVCKSCDAKRGAGFPYDGYDSYWKARMLITNRRLLKGIK
jgi:hypothetical protein